MELRSYVVMIALSFIALAAIYYYQHIYYPAAHVKELFLDNYSEICLADNGLGKAGEYLIKLQSNPFTAPEFWITPDGIAVGGVPLFRIADCGLIQ